MSLNALSGMQSRSAAIFHSCFISQYPGIASIGIAICDGDFLYSLPDIPQTTVFITTSNHSMTAIIIIPENKK
ncbi:hypothetical protein DMH17_15650 [Raoultella planticola]|nr:hypothetical protein [Raoultella planticola]